MSVLKNLRAGDSLQDRYGGVCPGGNGPAGCLVSQIRLIPHYIVPVAETAFVIPAKAGIQLFRSGLLLSQG